MYSSNAADTRDWVRMIQAVAKGQGKARVDDDEEFEVISPSVTSGGGGGGSGGARAGARGSSSGDGGAYGAQQRPTGRLQSRGDAAPPPVSMFGQIHSHTAEFMDRRSKLTQNAFNLMECYRTRVQKYLQGDQKK